MPVPSFFGRSGCLLQDEKAGIWESGLASRYTNYLPLRILPLDDPPATAAAAELAGACLYPLPYGHTSPESS